MKVSEIATRLIEEMSDEDDVYVSIKAMVENDKSDPEVCIVRRGSTRKDSTCICSF